jgi:hypothetical protein
MKKILFLLISMYVFMICCSNKKQQNNILEIPEYKTEPIIFDSSHAKLNWLENYKTANKLINSIPLPEGYERENISKSSFSYWLRQLPIDKKDNIVHLYNGEEKQIQSSQYAILDIDVGKEDLQQCADAVMRLRSEYLYHTNQFDKIHFNYTSGDKASWDAWRSGKRPIVNGNKVTWVQKYGNDDSYSNFKNYLRNIFIFCGSLSLSRELKTKSNIHEIQAGDVFIKGGTPGHAEIVLDVAVNKKTGKKIFLLAQSYMPAQEIHILKNPTNESLSPWYEEDFDEELVTPEYTFSRNMLMSFE